jgi:hypothetical protein
VLLLELLLFFFFVVVLEPEVLVSVPGLSLPMPEVDPPMVPLLPEVSLPLGAGVAPPVAPAELLLLSVPLMPEFPVEPLP